MHGNSNTKHNNVIKWNKDKLEKLLPMAKKLSVGNLVKKSGSHNKTANDCVVQIYRSVVQIVKKHSQNPRLLFHSGTWGDEERNW